MEIIIKGEPKEITDLLQQIQSQQSKEIEIKVDPESIYEISCNIHSKFVESRKKRWGINDI